MCTLGGPFSSSTGTFRDVGTGLRLRAARQRLLCCLTHRDFDDGVELRKAGLFFPCQISKSFSGEFQLLSIPLASPE
jgi:hypothetical protein